MSPINQDAQAIEDAVVKLVESSKSTLATGWIARLAWPWFVFAIKRFVIPWAVGALVVTLSRMTVMDLLKRLAEWLANADPKVKLAMGWGIAAPTPNRYVMAFSGESYIIEDSANINARPIMLSGPNAQRHAELVLYTLNQGIA